MVVTILRVMYAGRDKQHSETFIVAAVNERTLFIMTDKGTSA